MGLVLSRGVELVGLEGREELVGGEDIGVIARDPLPDPPIDPCPKFKIRSISAISTAVSKCPNLLIRIFPAMGPYL